MSSNKTHWRLKRISDHEILSYGPIVGHLKSCHWLISLIFVVVKDRKNQIKDLKGLERKQAGTECDQVVRSTSKTNQQPIRFYLTNQQPIRFNLDVEFCRLILPHYQILCLHHFNLRSLYLQSSQSLPNSIQLQTSVTSPMCTLFQWINNKNTLSSATAFS